MDLSKLDTQDLSAIAAGDMSALSEKALRQLAQMTAPPPEPPPLPGAGERALIGMGKAFTDVGRGVKQMGMAVADVIPGVDLSQNRQALQSRIDEEKRLAAPVMNTGMGQLGYAGGLVASALAPGGVVGAGGKLAGSARAQQLARALTVPNTYSGAALQGAGLGALPATATDESRLQNMAMGAAGGVGGELVGRGVAAGLGAAGALARPFTQGGQERIVNELVGAAASDPVKVAEALRTQPRSLVPGSESTLAEMAGDPGISALQRALANNPEMGAVINQRLMQNAAARRQALQGLAGDESQIAAAKAARGEATAPLYKQAEETIILGEAPELQKLMERPSMEKAVSEASRYIREAGLPIEEGAITGRQLQYMDQALSDMIGQAPKKEQRLLLDTQGELRGWMEKNIPEYMQAQKLYADLSKPINQMQVGQQLYDALAPELTNYGAMGKETAASLARAVRNAEQTVKKATGQRSKTIKDVLTTEQYDLVQNVLKDLARKANLDDLGRGAGSNTAQNLIGQNFVRRALGPLGLPESFTEGQFMQRMATPLSKAGNLFGAENALQQRLAEALANPQNINIPLRQPVNQQALARALLGQAPALAGTSGVLAQ